jgi:dynein heavy chain 1
LDVLNKSSGKILEDDIVLSTLENLKLEAFAEEQKVKEIKEVIAAVLSVSQRYQLVAKSCCRIFFALQKLNSLHFLYQFSFNSFLDIFCAVLRNTEYVFFFLIDKFNILSYFLVYKDVKMKIRE